ncbi:MAG: hypothetical protein DCC58_13635 [Chloroflexi bacterium]|nr:MAG: hypothetical protein DCC58_13635 [Chloroflexota bacterium]
MDDRRIDYLARMLRCAASRRQLLKTLAGLVAGGVATNGARPIQARAAARLAPGTPAFARTWERADRPVASGVVSRTWIWGPEANTPVLSEPYQESPGGARVVQYFDKTRMEVTHPEGDPASLWYVTNGLLVVELMTGQLQLGDTTFERHAPAEINVAGDADDPSGPTYATMALVRLAPPRATGAIITERIDRSGHISVDPTLTVHGVTAAQRVSVPGIDHQVAAPFWAFMTSAGTVFVDGAFRTEPLFSDPFYGTGLPVTEAYWARVKVAGSARDVLLQCFERRCLTYTPGNPPGFETEAGNVGQHYYHWRYVVLPGGAAPNYVYRASWGGPFDPESGMRGPYGLDVDTDGNVYVADYDRHRIQKYTPDGLLLTSPTVATSVSRDSGQAATSSVSGAARALGLVNSLRSPGSPPPHPASSMCWSTHVCRYSLPRAPSSPAGERQASGRGRSWPPAVSASAPTRPCM